ncbi:MAG: RIP metalloprotease RseP [Alphaproteobacteria bacterium]|nr:RIP metalloprotease RseP [Alphaproteobacteria bacterium]
MVFTILSFLVVLGLCVMIHEWGHFFAARRIGVKVITFSIGFGKALYSWTDSKGTVWKIGWMPLGGYVQVPTGDVEENKKLKIKKSETLDAKNPWQKIFLAINGIVMNFVLAFVLIFSVFAFKGIPQTPAVIDEVSQNSPAEKAGLLVGDVILKADHKEVKKFEDLKQRIVLLQKKTIEIEVNREGKVIVLSLTPEMGENKMPQIGVVARTSLDNVRHVGVGEASIETAKEMVRSVQMMFNGLGQIISGERSSKELGGFISIAKMSGRAAESGFYAFLFFIAFISMNLGVLNLFPIPGLDGGQIVFFLYEGIFRRPAPEKLQIGLTYIGFGFLIFLMIYSTVNDVIRAL